APFLAVVPFSLPLALFAFIGVVLMFRRLGATALSALHALPWVVGAVTLLPFVPLIFIVVRFAGPFALAEIVLTLPSSLGLVWLARDCARRADAGEAVLPGRVFVVFRVEGKFFVS